MLYCPHFRDLRNSRLRNIDIGSEFLDSPRPSVALINLLSLCAKEPTRLQSLGSFVRLSLRLREKWLQENVSCGLQLTQPAQVGLAAAQMYYGSIHAWRSYQHLASPNRFNLRYIFRLPSGAAFFATPDGVRFRVHPFSICFSFFHRRLSFLPLTEWVL